MIESFCTAFLLHFSKRFGSANIHFSIEITLFILHFFHFSGNNNTATLFSSNNI